MNKATSIASILLLVLFIACKPNTKHSNVENGVQTDTAKQEEPNGAAETVKWSEGGTLTTAKFSEWKSADDRNKLASCAEMLKLYLQNAHKEIPALEVLREKAVLLKSCIDGLAGQMPADMSVGQAAGACFLQMNL